jgi:hypothetical protein
MGKSTTSKDQVRIKHKFIPYSHQWIENEDINLIIKTLRSDWLTQGPKVDEFEKELVNYCGAKYAVAFSSGTAALHAAYFTAGLHKDNEIITSPVTFLSKYEFYITGGWNDARHKMDELNKCDYILIGGGGLILRNIGHQTDIIRGLKKPFGLIGVSIEAKHKSMEVFFRLVKQKADFILVRDKQSKIYLDNHYKVIVGPDLTFLYPFDVVKGVKNDVCGFNLRDWYYWKATHFGNYYNVMVKLNNISPLIRRIYPFRKWDPDEAVVIVKKNFKYVLPIPFYFERNVINDLDVLSKYFGNIPSTFGADQYNKIRYLIGMRYHSIVFATQCGIPFLSLSYQPKNDTFCSDIGLDMLSVDIYKINGLESKIDYVKNHYQQIREHLILYRERCIQDIKHICKSLFCLIEETIENKRKNRTHKE